MNTFVAVGSTNPVKIAAVHQAFQQVWPESIWQIEGVSVTSDVSAQPMSNEECITGARNRARKALQTLKADYGVGLEGGLFQVGDAWFNTGWIVVIDAVGREGIGATIAMATPESVMRFIQEGMELGDICDRLFHQENSKQGDGYFGLLTQNAVTRTTGYTQGVLSALARFLSPELF
ncbi:inosine/xanthosine triphosphatase [Thermosporothrix hazakensis]|uniref:Probable inosine/xanthosine triphosphatase n=1 Tax=Thermosporothrix hazakensis TaxID=644383 RepID=A0A326UFI1_THEHA|nr:inosine/xanthosine triphosphatase [Thermosporothrix hazakensis]PZW25659.1 inosine/xanthosine triphosphatase [Thermosporothrix hazakensis]GCE48154.1 non-canonical purine NTP phosphatase [Thermosporothrix hazakensis]